MERIVVAKKLIEIVNKYKQDYPPEWILNDIEILLGMEDPPETAYCRKCKIEINHYCWSCGNEVEDYYNYCPDCGESL